MIETFIQKGEAVLIHSDVAFDVRVNGVRASFKTYPEITVYAKEKVLMEDVRDFVYEMQKESTGDMKIGVLICDDIAVAAQHALLKVLEDMTPDTCILIYTHVHAVFLSTVLSRVVVKFEESDDKKKGVKTFKNKTVGERFEIIKVIMKEYDDEELSKQDITTLVEDIQKGDEKRDLHRDVYARAFSMLKQPSVSVKYVLEYVAGNI